MKLDNKLAYWRSKRGLTVVELAERSGVSSRTIAYIEDGNSALDSTIGKLALVLDIDIMELADLILESTRHPQNKKR